MLSLSVLESRLSLMLPLSQLLVTTCGLLSKRCNWSLFGPFGPEGPIGWLPLVEHGDRHLPGIRHRRVKWAQTFVHLAHNTEAFCCSLEQYLCSNEEAGGVSAMGWRHTAVILFLFEGDHGI